jgi:hypothetical protein
VSERLGHASVGITLDTYSHVPPELRREVVARLQKLSSRALEIGKITLNVQEMGNGCS